MTQRRCAQRGFTLIELMTVLAVLALLLSMAYPAYLEQVRKANRSEAMEALSRAAVAQERHLFRYGGYAASLGGAVTAEPPGLGLPDTTREDAGDDAYYTLTLSLDGPLRYTLRAAPAGSLQRVDKCGTLTLSSRGQRGAASAGCW